MPALDTQEKNTPPTAATTPHNLSTLARRDRYQARDEIRATHETTKAACCGLYVLEDSLSITRNGDKASLSGSMLCGRVWTCPVCSCIIGSRRSQEMIDAITKHMESGGCLYFLTLTMKRVIDIPLAYEMDVMTRAWSLVVRSRWWQAMAHHISLTGHIKSVEIVYREQIGWGPHLHLAILTDGVMEPDLFLRFWSEVNTKWQKAVAKYARALKPGDPSNPERLGVGVDFRQVALDDIGDIAGYLVKDSLSGAMAELTHPEGKKGRGASLGPFELARSGAKGNQRHLDLWHEYERAVKGRHRLRWSRGLRDKLGLTNEKSDDEILADAENDDTIVKLTELQTLIVLAVNELIPVVLEAAERGGPEEVTKVLNAAIASMSWADISRLKRWGSDRFKMKDRMLAGRKPVRFVP